MLEARATHYLAAMQLRVANPCGSVADTTLAADQDLYHVIASSSAIKRLRDVCERLRRSLAGGAALTVSDTVKYLGDHLGGSPGIAAYRAVAISAASTDAGDDEDVWLAPDDAVQRFLLIEYTRFWPVPVDDPGHMLIELEQGVRDRPLFTLESAVERRGCRVAMMWRSDGQYVGLGWRQPARERRVFVDRPLEARNEPAAVREMGLTPMPPDTRWHRRALRSLGEVARLA